MNDDPFVHDLYGREVDGYYWVYTEEEFQKHAATFRAAGNAPAAAIIDRLAETTDDVPAEIIREHQEFWNVTAYMEAADEIEIVFEELAHITGEMMEAIARGEYAPATATVYVLEFNRRASGRARPGGGRPA
jgi:hypothetical protein